MLVWGVWPLGGVTHIRAAAEQRNSKIAAGYSFSMILRPAVTSCSVPRDEQCSQCAMTSYLIVMR